MRTKAHIIPVLSNTGMRQKPHSCLLQELCALEDKIMCYLSLPSPTPRPTLQRSEVSSEIAQSQPLSQARPTPKPPHQDFAALWMPFLSRPSWSLGDKVLSLLQEGQ